MIIKENNTEITNKLEIAYICNTYFTSIGSNLTKNIHYSGEKNHRYNLKNAQNTNFKFKEIDEDTIKSYGSDGISTNLLKHIAPSLIKSLALITNQIIHTGVFPEKLKLAKVIPIFKKEDPALLTNYRPISLLPTISKVIEKVTSSQLYEYFEDSKLFAENQYGFRPCHSTEYAAVELVDRITTQMDNNKIPINIFLDLSNAFDSMNHKKLLDKLKYYGTIQLELFNSYLTNRKQYIELGDIKSKTLNISTGIPQGSILGPLLFIIYINDISQSSEMFNFITYADDTTLSSTLNNFKNSENIDAGSLINDELGKINEWLEINKLSLNINKSRYMLFHRPNKQVNAPTLQISNTNITKVNEFNFLGLTLDTNLKWRKHSEITSNKCSRTTGVLNKLKHILTQNKNKIIYNTLVLPHMNYCIMAWGSQCERIYKVQKKAVRILTSRYNSHTDPLFKRLNLLKITDLLRLQELKFYYKFMHNQLPSYLQNWQLTPNANIHTHNTRRQHELHTFRTQHEFAKRCPRHNLLNTLNNTPALVVVIEKNHHT